MSGLILFTTEERESWDLTLQVQTVLYTWWCTGPVLHLPISVNSIVIVIESLGKVILVASVDMI